MMNNIDMKISNLRTIEAVDGFSVVIILAKSDM